MFEFFIYFLIFSYISRIVHLFLEIDEQIFRVSQNVTRDAQAPEARGVVPHNSGGRGDGVRTRAGAPCATRAGRELLIFFYIT